MHDMNSALPCAYVHATTMAHVQYSTVESLHNVLEVRIPPHHGCFHSLYRFGMKAMVSRDALIGSKVGWCLFMARALMLPHGVHANDGGQNEG